MGIAVHNAGINGAHEHWGCKKHLKEEQNNKGEGVSRNIKIKKSKTYKKKLNPLYLDHKVVL
jgi:hypothetical protein